METKKRDFSVDIVKFVAVFLIINSHADIAYPHFPILATGGAIGDTLFLFVSGFTLFLGRQLRFDNYYKRRINRIYPSVIAAVMIKVILGTVSAKSFSLSQFLGGEFIRAIMIYYIILWIVQKYCCNRIVWVFILTVAVTLVAYYFFPYKYETSSKGIYGVTTSFRWIPYFGAMLMGAYVGLKRDKLKFNFKLDLLKFSLCLVFFYSIQFVASKVPAAAPFQIITIIFLFGIVFYFYKCCNAEFLHKIYETNWGNKIILLVSGLCLESYLMQGCVITDKLNFIFPLNLLIIFIGVLILAYITRCLARLFSQTFRTEDYDWRKIFSLI